MKTDEPTTQAPTSLDERRAADIQDIDSLPESEGMTAPSAMASVPWAAIGKGGLLAALVALLSAGLLVAWRQTRNS